MIWLPENLFEYQFIRPKKHFRACYNKNCKSGKRRFHIVENDSYDKLYKQVLEWCNCCHDEDDEFSITIPSYMIDYNLLLATHSDLNNPKYLNESSEKVIQNKIKYYKELKKSVVRNPYFKYLKRARNRHQLQKKNKN